MIMSLRPLALSLFLGFCAISCQTTAPPEPTGDPLGELAGEWSFSHFGTPTVWNSDLPDPTSATPNQFSDARISLDENGQGSMLMAGRAQEMEFEVKKATRSFIELGVKGVPMDNPFVYDRSEKTLMMPTNLDVNGTDGVLPTYFRR